MRSSFRVKLLGILGIATLAFSVLLGIGVQLEERAHRELTRISENHVPRIELGLRLMARFDALVQAISNAVAAQDVAALEATRNVRDTLMVELDRANLLLEPTESVAARAAVRSYYASAAAASQLIASGQGGERSAHMLAEMQRKQRLAGEALRTATVLDPADLTRVFESARATQQTAGRSRLIVSVSCLLLVLCCSLWLSQRVMRALREIGGGFARFGRGEFDTPIRVFSNDEFGKLAEQANQMAASLKELIAQRERTNWLTGGANGLLRELRGELEPEAVAQRACSYLSRLLGAPAAAVYWSHAQGDLHLLGQHGACTEGESALPARMARSSGLLGQRASDPEITVLDDVPPDYFRLCSALGNGVPRTLVLVPLMRIDQEVGFLELALFGPWTDDARDLLLSLRGPLVDAIEVAMARRSLRKLLEETQQQAALLGRQEDELRANYEELQTQQEELLRANTALQQQAAEVEAHRRTLEGNNAELVRTRRTLERKAQELTTVSAYKSQFLATMSHELRTPLNSMLLLSNLLAEHQAGALTEQQTEYCRTIHAAATDLLALINQVLDLARVESGKQEVRLGVLPLRDLVRHAHRMLEPLAREKGLDFEVTLESDEVPESIVSDRRKVEQIINNLLGNAIKFTDAGRVALHIGRPPPSTVFSQPALREGAAIAITVSDTGSGIAPHDRERIFAAFEQVDSATDRRHHGSGLGLSIARELATLLGGELHLAESTVGRGSVFVCHLPADCQVASVAVPAQRPSMVHSLPAPRLSLAAPAVAVERAPRRARVLVVEDERGIADLLIYHFEEIRIEPVVVGSAAEALARIAGESFSCIVLDLGLPDLDGIELLKRLRAHNPPGLPPVLVYTGRALSDAQFAWLEEQAEVVVLKEGLAIERIVDEVRLLIDRLEDGVTRRPGAATVVPAERVSLKGRKLLVADDDMRNVFALSALLEAKGAVLLTADNGRHALETMNANPDVDLVLMDMMMPEVDGYEAIRTLRRDPRFAAVPIIALTAKAMKNDRERCLLAGATDYLSKPVDAELLLAMVGALLTGPAPVRVRSTGNGASHAVR